MNKKLSTKMLEAANYIHSMSRSAYGNYMVTNLETSKVLNEHSERTKKLEERKDNIKKILKKQNNR
tara:strand:+ start:236 stop:433 length:198 start_codon:yes stop_codon:yes gene_type:complete